MATKRTPGSRPGLVRCSHCGEEYSESYRRCPFCADFDADAKYETQRTHTATYGTARTAAAQSSTSTRPSPSRATSSRSTASRGGKRVTSSNRRGGGYKKVSAGKIVAWLLSLIIIIAAIWILVTQVGPMFGLGSKDKDTDKDTKDPSTSQTTPEPDTSPEVSAPAVSDEPDVAPSPSTQVPSGDTATGFTLSTGDFSFNDKYPDPVALTVTFSPSGTTAAIIWSSSDPGIASVDANGVVSHGSTRGTATITASMANGIQQTCIVRNQVTSGAAYEPEPTPAQSSYSLSKTDFTFFSAGESTKLKVLNYTGTISWTSSNTGVAKVDPDGTVVATGTGNTSCVITATLDDGSQLKAVARINIS